MTDKGIPTKALLDSWRPHQLDISDLGQLNHTTEIYSQFGYENVRRVGLSEWDGLCRRAAEDRAGQQYAWGTRVARRIGAVGSALYDASEALTHQLQTVNTALMRAIGERCSVIDDNDPQWPMKYSRPKDNTLTDQQITALEEEWSQYMRTTAAEVMNVCHDHARTISKALSELATATPPKLGLSGQDGRRDGLAGQDGWTRDEARRVAENLKIAGLTDEQIRTLLNGGKLTDVPRGVNEYLHMFYNNTTGYRLAELKKVMTEIGMADHTRYIGDGLLTLSNENAGPNTGYQYIPPWARVWVEKRNTEPTPRLNQTMATVLSGTRVPPGERFGTELQRKAADIAYLLDPSCGCAPDTDVYLGSARGVESTARKLLEVGTRNHQSSTAILTGKYSSGTPLADYDDDARSKTITSLYRVEWLDNGKTAGHTIDWVDDYAGSGDPEKVALANRAYKGLFDVVTDTHGDNNFSRLMNFDFSRLSLGEVNPALADALRQATNPYLTYLADPTSQHIHHQSDLDLADSGLGREFEARAIRMFTLIASDDAPNHLVDPKNIDPENPDGVNAATELWRDVLERSGENTATAGDNPENAHSLGTLQAQLLSRAQAGIYGAQFDQELDAGASTAATNETKQNLYKVMNAGSALVGLVPGGAIVGAPVAAIAPYVTAPSDVDSPEFHLPASSVSASKAEQYLAALLPMFAGSGAEVPSDWLDENNRIKSADELIKQEKVDASALTQRVTTSLREYDSATYDVVLREYNEGWTKGGNDTDLQFNATSRENYQKHILNG